MKAYMAHRGNTGTLSVIIPLYNEGANVVPMYEALHKTLAELPYVHELIFVDDGSSDGTWDAIMTVSKTARSVKGIRFSRNFGKEAALEAGLKNARGDAVIFIDGDLQHPPEVIPALVREWEAGHDIVRTVHASAFHRGWLKRLASSMFYRLFALTSDISLTPHASDFCLISRTVADELHRLSEKQKFHRMLLSWVGFPSTTVSYTANDRARGVSSYTMRRLFSLARTAIVSSSTFPMTVIFLLGCVLACVGAVLTVGLLLYKLFVDFEYIGGAVVLAAFVIFNNGLLLIALGVVSLYVVAAYREVQNRPSYVVRDTV